MGETITIKGPDGSFSAYVGRPETTPAPALVVIQDIFGVNHVMRAISDEFAAHGFLAVCPDLFWRFEPDLQLDDHKEADLQRAFQLYPKFDVGKGVADIAATITAARGLQGSSGKVGVVGFCLGGLLTFLSAARTDADAARPLLWRGDRSALGRGWQNSPPADAASRRGGRVHPESPRSRRSSPR